MPYETHEEEEGLYIRYYGFLAPFEVLAVNEWQAATAEPRHRYMIFDLLGIDADAVFAWDRSLVEKITKKEQDVLARITWPMSVVLVASHGKTRELVDRYAADTRRPSSHHVQVVSTVTAARRLTRSAPQRGGQE